VNSTDLTWKKEIVSMEVRFASGKWLSYSILVRQNPSLINSAIVKLPAGFPVASFSAYLARTWTSMFRGSPKAKQQLQSDFEKHECKPQPQTVDDMLEHIN
jgi:hypothetical protein